MSLNSLNKIENFIASISNISWFINTGKKIDGALEKVISNYCQEIGINDKVIPIQSWEEAIKVINSDKWNKDCWEIEEREKTNSSDTSEQFVFDTSTKYIPFEVGVNTEFVSPIIGFILESNH